MCFIVKGTENMHMTYSIPIDVRLNANGESCLAKAGSLRTGSIPDEVGSMVALWRPQLLPCRHTIVSLKNVYVGNGYVLFLSLTQGICWFYPVHEEDQSSSEGGGGEDRTPFFRGSGGH